MDILQIAIYVYLFSKAIEFGKWLQSKKVSIQFRTREGYKSFTDCAGPYFHIRSKDVDIFWLRSRISITLYERKISGPLKWNRETEKFESI